jgi:hypothetical protein
VGDGLYLRSIKKNSRIYPVQYRMFKKASSAAAASEEAKTYPLWYVESLSDARTKLEAFFNILLRGTVRKSRQPRHLLSFQELKRRAAACGDEGHIFGFTGPVHGQRRVPAADNRESVGV